jgi:uncharacterized protein YbjT (DUF2867 family)
VAVLAGASGLVGSRLLRLLLACDAYSQVLALVRRPLGIASPRLQEREAHLEKLNATLDDLAPSRRFQTELDVFCCLGSTIRTAGSREAFARVDRDYVIALGVWAAQAQARRLLVVSAMGANVASRVFYNRIKGEMEAGLRALPLRSLVLFRPGLLDGVRTERRVAEQIALTLLRPVSPLLPKRLRPVSSQCVATSLLEAALAVCPPAVVDSAAIQDTKLGARFGADADAGSAQRD